MVEPSPQKSRFDQILSGLSDSLSKNEQNLKEAFQNAQKNVREKFDHLNDLREKLKIENEKQKVLLRLVSQLKYKKNDKWEEKLEQNEIDYMKKQIEILSHYLSIKKEELVLKQAMSAEKSNQISQLEQKLNNYQSAILSPDPPVKKEPKAVFKSKPVKKTIQPDDFFSELLH